jgi:beta-lactam-binding protein with PASTA domain
MHGSTVFLIAFVTSVATAAGTVYVIDKYGILPPRGAAAPEAIVPELRGVTENDARGNAATAHIALLVASREPSADAKGGTVLRQSIAAGQHVPHDYPVSIVIADEVTKVPAVTGLLVAEATQRVEQRGYHLQVSATVPDPTAPQGSVLEQTPKADSVLAKGETVAVRVSAGPGDIELPKMVGIGINQAKADLEKLGVKPVVRWVALPETPTYVVLNQKPPAGEKVKPGSEVTLTVCSR